MIHFAFTILVSLFAISASADVVAKQEGLIETKLQIVRLSAEAKCLPARSEDEGPSVHYSKESYTEIESYRGYSSKLIGRTCGVFGSATELSKTDYEKVEVLLYNYGAAKSDFDAQVRDLVDGF